MELRAFTRKGREKFKYILDEKVNKETPKDDFIKEIKKLVNDPDQSTWIRIRSSQDKEIRMPKFETNNNLKRSNVLKKINKTLEIFEDITLENSKLKGMWTWLSAYLLQYEIFYSDSYLNKDDGQPSHIFYGDFDLKEYDYKRSYRHNIFLLIQIMRENPSHKLLFTGTVDSWGDIREQILSRPQIYRSKGILAFLDKLYYESSTAGIKSRATSNKPKETAGCLRRVLTASSYLGSQFFHTYNLQEMSVDEIENLFKSSTTEFDQDNFLKDFK